MNRKERRKQQSKNRKMKSRANLRVIEGGGITPDALAKAMPPADAVSKKIPPPQMFADTLGLLLHSISQHEQQMPPERRCSDTDKLAVLMRVCCATAIALEVPYDQLLDGFSMIYREQMEKLDGESS